MTIVASGCAVAIALVLTHDGAVAGRNHGATIQLSWSSSNYLADVTPFSSDTTMLYVLLGGLNDVRTLALTMKWTPNSASGGFRVVGSPAGTHCAHTVLADSALTFNGEGGYTWTIRESVSGQVEQCIAYGITATGGRLDQPGNFWIARAVAEDSDGRLDTLRVLTSATANGGLPGASGLVAHSGYAEVARAAAGHILWYGHRLAPPFVFEVNDRDARLWLRVDHLDAFAMQGIVRIPTVLPPVVSSRSPETAIPPAMMAVHAVGSAAHATYQRLRKAGSSMSTARDSARNVYLAHPDVVASAELVAEASLRVVYRHSSNPSYILLEDTRDPANDRSQAVRQHAQGLASTLQDGGILVIRGDGVLSLLPPRDTQHLLPLIEDLRLGRTQSTDEPLLRDLVDDLTRPVASIPTLLSRVR